MDRSTAFLFRPVVLSTSLGLGLPFTHHHPCSFFPWLHSTVKMKTVLRLLVLAILTAVCASSQTEDDSSRWFEYFRQGKAKRSVFSTPSTVRGQPQNAQQQRDSTSSAQMDTLRYGTDGTKFGFTTTRTIPQGTRISSQFAAAVMSADTRNQSSGVRNFGTRCGKGTIPPGKGKGKGKGKGGVAVPVRGKGSYYYSGKGGKSGTAKGKSGKGG